MSMFNTLIQYYVMQSFELSYISVLQEINSNLQGKVASSTLNYFLLLSLLHSKLRTWGALFISCLCLRVPFFLFFKFFTHPFPNPSTQHVRTFFVRNDSLFGRPRAFELTLRGFAPFFSYYLPLAYILRPLCLPSI